MASLLSATMLHPTEYIITSTARCEPVRTFGSTVKARSLVIGTAASPIHFELPTPRGVKLKAMKPTPTVRMKPQQRNGGPLTCGKRQRSAVCDDDGLI